MRTTNKCFKAGLCFACGCLLLLAMPVPAFSSGFALVVKNGINLVGSANIDSFNSQDPNYSSNGLYVLSKHEAHGDILTDASNLVQTTEITMSAVTHVYGHAFTAPNDFIHTSGAATIGDTNFAGPGIESGWFTNTANFSVPDAPPLPNVSWLPMPTMTNNTYVLNGGGPGQTSYYQIQNSLFNLVGGQTIVVTNGTVVLDVEGQFQMSGACALVVATNSSLTAWFNGLDMQLQNNAIINGGGFATNVIFYGTTNCTSIQISSPSFTGIIYAPEADILLSGSATIIGSVVANSIEVDNVGVHYDEALARSTSVPIWISAQSKSRAVPLGSNATFSVSTGGGLPASYQWFFNQTNLLASITNYLSLTNVQFSDVGNYSVVVTNLISGVTSAPAILFVYTNSAQLAAQIATPVSSMNGQFQFNLTGVSGFNYVIQASSNLVDWIPLATNVAPSAFTDTNNFPLQFYRAVFAP